MTKADLLALQAAIHRQFIHHRTGDACRSCPVFIECPAWHDIREPALCELDDSDAGIASFAPQSERDTWLGVVHIPLRPISKDWIAVFSHDDALSRTEHKRGWKSQNGGRALPKGKDDLHGQ